MFLRESVRVEKYITHANEVKLNIFPTLQYIDTQILGECINVLREIFEYMTECYRSLHEAFVSDHETWELVCYRMEDIFVNDFTVTK